MRIFMMTTYPPRKCGIGEYAKNTAAELARIEHTDVWIGSLVNETVEEVLPEVVIQIRQDRFDDYEKVSRLINWTAIDVVIIQHEFSFYGGNNGNWVVDLLDRIKKPVITVFHSLDYFPLPSRAPVIREIVRKSAFVVSTTQKGKWMLQQDYGAAEARTLHIPLGAPDALPQERALFRKQLNVANRTVAMTFGLLNPYKGIELVLEAIPEVVEKHPDFMYWIVGSTHPDHAYGDSYYNKLVDLIDQYGIHNHVRLISGYQSEQDLIRLLTASDIYINPYWKINAVFASATMTYAARMGKTIISSPIDYSLELLSDGAGMIFPYGDVGAIARQLKMLLADQKEREAMGAKLKRKTSEYGWNDVAAAYWRVIERADDQSWRETDENEFEREREHEREHEQRGNGHELDTDNETDRVTLPIPPVPGDEKKNRPRAQLPASLQTARKRKKRNAAKKKKSPRSRQSRKIHSRYKTARLDTIVTFAAKPAGVKAPKRKRRRRRAA